MFGTTATGKTCFIHAACNAYQIPDPTRRDNLLQIQPAAGSIDTAVYLGNINQPYCAHPSKFPNTTKRNNELKLQINRTQEPKYQLDCVELHDTPGEWLSLRAGNVNDDNPVIKKTTEYIENADAILLMLEPDSFSSSLLKEEIKIALQGDANQPSLMSSLETIDASWQNFYNAVGQQNTSGALWNQFQANLLVSRNVLDKVKQAFAILIGNNQLPLPINGNVVNRSLKGLFYDYSFLSSLNRRNLNIEAYIHTPVGNNIISVAIPEDHIWRQGGTKFYDLVNNNFTLVDFGNQNQIDPITNINILQQFINIVRNTANLNINNQINLFIRTFSTTAGGANISAQLNLVQLIQKAKNKKQLMDRSVALVVPKSDLLSPFIKDKVIDKLIPDELEMLKFSKPTPDTLSDAVVEYWNRKNNDWVSIAKEFFNHHRGILSTLLTNQIDFQIFFVSVVGYREVIDENIGTTRSPVIFDQTTNEYRPPTTGIHPINILKTIDWVTQKIHSRIEMRQGIKLVKKYLLSALLMSLLTIMYLGFYATQLKQIDPLNMDIEQYNRMHLLTKFPMYSAQRLDNSFDLLTIRMSLDLYDRWLINNKVSTSNALKVVEKSINNFDLLMNEACIKQIGIAAKKEKSNTAFHTIKARLELERKYLEWTKQIILSKGKLRTPTGNIDEIEDLHSSFETASNNIIEDIKKVDESFHKTTNYSNLKEISRKLESVTQKLLDMKERGVLMTFNYIYEADPNCNIALVAYFKGEKIGQYPRNAQFLWKKGVTASFEEGISCRKSSAGFPEIKSPEAFKQYDFNFLNKTNSMVYLTPTFDSYLRQIEQLYNLL
ncbi:MAG: hypothetical protein HQK65_16145 [Desulfamplus sp.]|nr:hypothetical protein [Desulfamplus sp.]